MKWPSIDQTRAYFQIFAAAVLLIVLVYMVISGRGDVDSIIKIILTLLIADKSINGVGIVAREVKKNGQGSE